MRTVTRRPSAGFTLVELLVVIGIIALLIAILLPALAGARRSAIKTQCLNNFRQVGNAVLMYTVTYKGTFPGPSTKGVKAYYGLDGNIAVYLSTYLAPFLNLPQPDGSATGQLNPYFVCPAFPYDKSLIDNYVVNIAQTYVPLSQQTSPNVYGTDAIGPTARFQYPFGYASAVAGATPETPVYTISQDPMKISQIQNSESVVLIREMDSYNTTTNTTTGQPLSGITWSSGWQIIKLPFHGLQGKVATRNKLYVDGHAASVLETP
jgi:prepilin-type N-terminal cleavage/methylation domain-containing protein